jgi:uncharacterized RDD family membrane protein YckC
VQTNTPAVGIRLLSMLIDHAILCFVCAVPLLITNIIFFDPFESNSGGSISTFLFGGIVIIYLLKDSYEGRSLAKRMVGLQVADNKTGQVASVGQCFVRNIFIIIWPVEVIVAAFNPERRIGDLVAGTRVSRYRKDMPVLKEEEF